MAKFISKNAKETGVIAKRLAAKLKGGELLGLMGNLGAGKTVFVKAMAEALGVKNNITSPTFVLMKIYDTKHKTIKKLVHVDCYRLDGREDLLDIGLADYLDNRDMVVVVEWADKVAKLPTNAIKIKIDYIKNNQRKIVIENFDYAGKK